MEEEFLKEQERIMEEEFWKEQEIIREEEKIMRELENVDE